MSDFNEVAALLTQQRFTRREIEFKLKKYIETLKKYGSLEKMATMPADTALIYMRKYVNNFTRQFEELITSQSLDMFSTDFENISRGLLKAGYIKSPLDIPDPKAYTKLLLNEKFDQFKYYTERSVFLLQRRVTLFELEGKKALQDAVIGDIVSMRGTKSQGEMLDALLKRLDTEYPAGYITLPVTRTKKDGTIERVNKKIPIDYYADTWISDVESSIHNTALRSSYLKAGLDLVKVECRSAVPCDLCKPERGKIFSLTGNDPDFPSMDFVLPRHPRCHCYIVPVVGQGRSNQRRKVIPQEGTTTPALYKGVQLKGADDLTRVIGRVFQADPKRFSGIDYLNTIKRSNLPKSVLGSYSPKTHTIKLAERTFDNVLSGMNSIANGKKRLSEIQENALSTLWHEISHVMDKGAVKSSWDSPQRYLQEMVTELHARYTYPEFIRLLGGKSKIQNYVIKNGAAYKEGIEKFRGFLTSVNVTESDFMREADTVISQMRDWNKSVGKISEILADLSGKTKEEILIALDGFFNLQK